VAGAARTAEKIRSLCATTPYVTAAGPLTVTASFGVADLGSDLAPPGAAAEALLRHADAALYRSKREGRNRVSTVDSLSDVVR
jgi:PleD family two-component response regulator